VRENEMNQFPKVLDTGEFSRPDGLTDHRFGPQELTDLFKQHEMQVLPVAGICPFFEFLPGHERVRVLDDENTFEMMLNVGERYAEDPSVVGISGRLLIAARKMVVK